jgi:GT2 family glycosyltransferase
VQPTPAVPGSVTVIVPALHRPDLTERCLRSLEQQDYARHLVSVVLVENAAFSGPVLQMDSLPPKPNLRLHQILLKENLATTGAVNIALNQSNSEFVLLLNNDVEIAPAFISMLVAALQRNQSLGFATAKMLNGREPKLLDGAGDEVLLGGGAYRIGHGDFDTGQYEQTRIVLSGCGGATLYRRSLMGASPLDNSFFAYLEDVDLALGMLLKGARGIFVPEAVAFHLGSATLGDPEHPAIFEGLTCNQLLLLISNFPPATLLAAAPRIFIFQTLWMGRAVLSGRLGAYIRAMLRAARLFPIALQKRRLRLGSCTISSAEFRAALLQSEAQIYRWQAALPLHSRSRLLNAYFLFFRPRPSACQER